MRALIWFRTDLRTRDNLALHAAASGATEGVVALYVISPGDWHRHDDAAVKVDFVLRNLRELSVELEGRNIALLIETAGHCTDVPKVVARIAGEQRCTAMYFNREYEVDERERDERTAELLGEVGRGVHGFDGSVVLPPGGVLTNDGGFYTVHSPFKRKWRARFDELGRPEPLPLCRKQSEMVGRPSAVPERVEGFDLRIGSDEWPAGEAHAKRRLGAFLGARIEGYKDKRNFPGVNGTSTMSPYLTSGVVSPRQMVHAAMTVNQHKHDSGKRGVVTWIEEIVWREFYKHMLVGFPRVSRHRPLQLATERIRWNENDTHFEAWKAGRTGYPIVDAAMRQLTRRGWMHNRLRMIAASFFSKDLFLDWRRGEAWFMRNLIDGDLASNNGGWQWSASVGADAQPYFRVFNPTTQGEKFDPDGGFVREFVEELRDVDTKEVHDPSPLTRERCGYPQPIVEHKAAREHAIGAFKEIKRA